MADACVVNASPLIFLARGGHLGVPVAGTLGIVLLARRRGVITAARPVMDDLVAGGMFLSRAVLDRALASVGE